MEGYEASLRKNCEAHFDRVIRVIYIIIFLRLSDFLYEFSQSIIPKNFLSLSSDNLLLSLKTVVWHEKTVHNDQPDKYFLSLKKLAAFLDNFSIEILIRKELEWIFYTEISNENERLIVDDNMQRFLLIRLGNVTVLISGQEDV